MIKEYETFKEDANALYLGVVDDAGGIESYNYINLAKCLFEKSGKDEETITLHFYPDVIQIIGRSLGGLFDAIEHHNISRVRRGISEDPNSPQIKNITKLKPKS